MSVPPLPARLNLTACPLRAFGRRPDRGNGPLARPPELGGGPTPGLGLPLRRVAEGKDRSRSVARPARPASPLRGYHSGLRGGRLGLAPLRRGGKSGARVPLPSQPPLHRAADRRRAGPRARLLGGSGGRQTRAPDRRRQRRRRRARRRVGRAPLSTGGVPLSVFDAGYDPVRLQHGLEGCRAQILVRLHSGRAFYAVPERPGKRPAGASIGKCRGDCFGTDSGTRTTGIR